MRKLKCAVVGYGDRGSRYSDYALKCPDELEVVAVVDPREVRRNAAKKAFSLPDEKVFVDIDKFLNANIDCDFVINATMDQLHYITATKLIDKGFDLLLEKPITAVPDELKDLYERSKKKGTKIVVCHVLRYTPFYSEIKNIIESGKMGKVVNLQLNEHVWYGHFVNAYVRGKWKSSKECGSGLLLAKCCHDTDLICWLNNGAKPVSVSSFGSKSLYSEKNAPEGSTEYCYDCPKKGECPFNAYDFELKHDFIPFYTWIRINKPLDEITDEEKIEYLKTDDFGKCVYRSGMDIVDRQCVSVEFDNGSIATLNMIAAGNSAGRHIHVVCEWGEIIGYVEENKLTVRYFDKKKLAFDTEIVDLNEVNKLKGNDNSVTGHYGGDHFIMKDLVRFLQGEPVSSSTTTIEDSLSGHFVVYAAERARNERRVVDIKEFE